MWQVLRRSHWGRYNRLGQKKGQVSEMLEQKQENLGQKLKKCNRSNFLTCPGLTILIRGRTLSLSQISLSSLLHFADWFMADPGGNRAMPPPPSSHYLNITPVAAHNNKLISLCFLYIRTVEVSAYSTSSAERGPWLRQSIHSKILK